VVVGSQEPRKNHSAVLFAAERLWNDGQRFRLRFIGGGGALHLRFFDAEIARLQAAGHAVEVVRGASDSVLTESYRQARFTVFPSLHEGFGLPVAESLALGTPVITADHGSLAEAAAGGGCLVVDARDDEALAVAMASLLTDDDLLGRLRAEARERSSRTWNDYAAELWAWLVEPLRSAAGAAPGQAVDGDVDVDAASDDDVDGDGTATATATATAANERSAAIDGPTAAQQQYDEQTLQRWWHAAEVQIAARIARDRSLIRNVAKVAPLARFFIARSREMGVVPAGKAAVRVVKRRVLSR
jgi:hypothetical protein